MARHGLSDRFCFITPRLHYAEGWTSTLKRDGYRVWARPANPDWRSRYVDLASELRDGVFWGPQRPAFPGCASGRPRSASTAHRLWEETERGGRVPHRLGGLKWVVKSKRVIQPRSQFYALR
jgi:hypothetical protein